MASINKRGSSWAVRISFYDASGKRHYKNKAGFKTKKEAEYYAHKNEVSKLQGDDILSSTKSFVAYFTEWYQTFKEPTIAAATKKNYLFTKDKITNYFDDMKIGNITRSMYQEFLNGLADTYSRETVAKIAGHCRACIIDAVEDGVIRHNFTNRTTVPNCIDAESEVGNNYLDVQDMSKLKDFIAPKASINNMSAVMILTSLLTGARYSEVAGLTWSDIDYKAKTIRINKTLDYKGDGDFLPTKTKASNRVITITDGLIKVLGDLHQEQVAAGVQNDLHLIFIGKHSTKVPTDNAVNKLLRTAHKKLGIKKITFHGLRHTHASYLIYKNVSIYVISQRLGHSDVGITQRVYAHVIAELRHEQVDLISDALENF
ncbi:prophage Lp2 protein 2, integrase [Lactiplantibacillus xiangfangensis]|uniref:Prophage Lp2 protein 2, integrase n=1 Tax=Lactiplantibacillus xiangfangensis TaxID=942150 RepID=A0A0R2MKL5_9LACO|nr:tyrosine-type recombinase/integrase [Lactiplantibacillus xiangfangensis]KRO14212.1 prophage Lp2 protein 2, integrase [Lactiplantibacillus xiangfangensis]